jgi:HlyD family secretion protein
VLGAAGVIWLVNAWSSAAPVEMAVAEFGVVREQVEEQAKTRLPRTYLITMPYEARIQPADLEEGARVEQGQVVARIVPEDLKIRLDEAQASVARLGAALRENADTSMEQIALQQSQRFLESIDRTVEASEQQVKAAEARLIYANRELERQRSLIARNAATAQELNRAETEQVEAEVAYRQSQLTWRATQSVRAAAALMPPLVRQYIERKGLRGDVLAQEQAEARARLAQAELNRARGTMNSPVDGVILRRESRDERLLSAGSVLFEIGRLADLEVEADVLSQDALRVRAGQRVELLSPTSGAVVGYGAVRTIYPAGFTKISSLGVEQQRVKVIVSFESESLNRLLVDERLGVGYQLRVRIVTAETPQALRVPRSAVFRGSGGGWRCFAVKNGVTRLAAVEVGLLNDDWVEIVKGLTPGDQVVVAPETDLTEGMRVRAVETAG